jgi:hypothetical protein
MHELSLYIYIYIIRCMNYVLYICYELLICSLKLWLTECRMCFKLQTECKFLSSSDGWADVSLPVAARGYSSNRRMMSSCPSLLEAIVAMDVFYPSLLCYHCSDGQVARGHSELQPIATMLVQSSARHGGRQCHHTGATPPSKKTSPPYVTHCREGHNAAAQWAKHLRQEHCHICPSST